jgi:predicted nucleotidyltransferase
MTEAGIRELLGTKEAAALYSVRPPNFVRDWASRPDFPEPVASLPAGRVWWRSDLEAYKASCGPKRGAKRQKLKLSPQAVRWLPTIKRRIVRGFSPERIVLFGSQARGDARPDSDVDLLVVLPSTDNRRAMAGAIYSALAGIPLDADVVVTTPEHLAENAELAGTVLWPATREGVTIYARS